MKKEGNFRWWRNDINKIILESAWVEGKESLGLNLKSTIYKMCFSVELFVLEIPCVFREGRSSSDLMSSKKSQNNHQLCASSSTG